MIAVVAVHALYHRTPVIRAVMTGMFVAEELVTLVTAAMCVRTYTTRLPVAAVGPGPYRVEAEELPGHGDGYDPGLYRPIVSSHCVLDGQPDCHVSPTVSVFAVCW